MSTVEPGRRVALLARPGAARDCVRGALLEVGAQLVAEDDPASADPASVRAAEPQVLMIVLDAASEDALGRFDVVIGDPGIEVMFEEAEVAVSREGWEAARWRRHLAAKLHHRDDVLPPTAAGGEGAGADALSLQLADLMALDAAGGGEVVELPRDAVGGSDFSVFDPVAAESASTDDAFVLTVDGLEFDATAFEGDDDALPPVTGPDFTAGDFAPLLAELDAQPGGTPAGGELQWHSEEPDAGDVAAPQPSSFGELSLAEDAAPVPVARGAAKHDLADLDRRISSLQLVDDEAPAGGDGVVLVLAGLGGPDAVRQFLGGLPAGFPRPVLIRQRLDGARYDKLVGQMQRATDLPVSLASADRPVAGGTVYIVPDDVALDATRGLRFVAGPAAGILEALPAGHSAVVLLSGGDAADADRIAALAGAGLWMGAQTADGCYDPAAAVALASRGAVTASPAELARQLAQRWSS